MKRRNFKVLLALVLCFSVFFISISGVFAGSTEQELAYSKVTKNFTKQDILSLEKYISVNKKGIFKLDKKSARKDNIDIELLNGQESYLTYLNSLILDGKIKADSNLNITNVSTTSNSREDANILFQANSSSHWPSCGGGISTEVAYHWWGYSRYLCDCQSQELAADLNSVASVGAGITVIAAYFGGLPAIPPGLASAYFWFFASRIDANNHGNGIYVEVTWVLAFDITPQ